MKVRASTYADRFVGRPTRSGIIYRHEGWTAALTDPGGIVPFLRAPSNPRNAQIIQVTNPKNGRSVRLKLADTGKGSVKDPRRVLDLSRAAYVYLSGRDGTAAELAQTPDWDQGILELSVMTDTPGKQLGPLTPTTAGTGTNLSLQGMLKRLRFNAAGLQWSQAAQVEKQMEEVQAQKAKLPVMTTGYLAAWYEQFQQLLTGLEAQKLKGSPEIVPASGWARIKAQYGVLSSQARAVDTGEWTQARQLVKLISDAVGGGVASIQTDKDPTLDLQHASDVIQPGVRQAKAIAVRTTEIADSAYDEAKRLGAQFTPPGGWGIWIAGAVLIPLGIGIYRKVG